MSNLICYIGGEMLLSNAAKIRRLEGQITEIMILLKQAKLPNHIVMWGRSIRRREEAIDYLKHNPGITWKKLVKKFNITVCLGPMSGKHYWKIFNTTTKKHVRLEDNRLAVFEWPIQAEKYIEKRLASSSVYQIRKC